MLSSANEPMQIRSRLQFSSQCSTQPSASQALSNAFGNCNIFDGSQLPGPSQAGAEGSDVSMTQGNASQTDGSSRSMGPPPSQAYLGSQDFLTPVEQGFEVEPAVGGKKMRSPSRLTPNKQGNNKRQRSNLSRGAGGGSQSSQGLPPLANGGPKHDRRHSPRCTHNAFSSAEEDPVHVARRLPLVTMYRELFREIKLLGQGNFSKVFHVKHRVDGFEYAVKRSKTEISQTDEALKRQWFQEVQALAAAGVHDNIVRYYGSWLEESFEGAMHFYIQLEKCETSLGHRFSVERAPMKEAELVGVLRQLAAGLAHLHSKGMAHMDVKPDNVYEDARGNFKLGDFGMATSLTGKGSLEVGEGDCRYLSPEVMNDSHSQLDKADMFALGATMYQLATGADLPEEGEAYSNLRNGRVKLLPAYSTSFQSLLKRLLSHDPRDRPSAKTMLADKLFKKPVASTGFNPLNIVAAGS